MTIVLAILSAIAWFILLSVKAKEPVDPIEEIKKEIAEVVEDDNEIIVQIVEDYKNTYSYKTYELKKAYFELGQAIKESFKKGE